jgi:hypothetical protein
LKTHKFWNWDFRWCIKGGLIYKETEKGAWMKKEKGCSLEIIHTLQKHLKLKRKKHSIVAGEQKTSNFTA